MSSEEILANICEYAIRCKVLDTEQRKAMSIDEFRAWVSRHYEAIPKVELVAGKEYAGNCRNSIKATWNGEVFVYERRKFGMMFPEEVNHYDDDDGFDVFVPIRERNQRNG